MLELQAISLRRNYFLNNVNMYIKNEYYTIPKQRYALNRKGLYLKKIKASDCTIRSLYPSHANSKLALNNQFRGTISCLRLTVPYRLCTITFVR